MDLLISSVYQIRLSYQEKLIYIYKLLYTKKYSLLPFFVENQVRKLYINLPI
jgi:hypothetical protein